MMWVAEVRDEVHRLCFVRGGVGGKSLRVKRGCEDLSEVGKEEAALIVVVEIDSSLQCSVVCHW